MGHTNMKFLILAALAAVASARPRYRVIDLDAMEEPRALYPSPPALARTARMAQEEDYQGAPYYPAMIGAIQNQHQAILTLPLLPLLVLTMLTMELTLVDMEHSDGILTILSYLLDTRTCSSRNSTVIFTGLNIFTLHSKKK